MILYYICAAIVLLIQVLILVEAYRHLHYTRHTYRPKPSKYHPKVALISPCKGLDNTFDRNIKSLFQLDYPDYEIFFVVESVTDPAYDRLGAIIQQYQDAAHAVRAHLLVAGRCASCSQKVHNLMFACDSIPQAFEVFAFVDSDACVKAHFLTSLVHPLRREGVGASTGYRWFVPTDSAWASKALSAINAFVASLMGPHKWNSAWGGAMAIRRDIYNRTPVGQYWTNACSDDYALSRAVKQADLVIIFVPACYIASYEQTTWSDLFGFARRQFLITRVARKPLWILALLSVGHFVVAFWGGLIFSIYLWAIGSAHAPYAAILPMGLMASSMIKATARQLQIRKILPEDRRRLVGPALLDIFFHPLLAVFIFVCLLASAGRRIILWRGIKYILHDIDHTEIIAVSPGKT